MITFKQFLAEAVITKWEKTPIDVIDAIKFLNKNCKDGIKAIGNNGLLFRGFSGGVATDKWMIYDSTKALRTSRDTLNGYQLMMDNSEYLSEYPPRSRAFICSSNFDTAEEFGTALVLIPLDGTKIAVSSKKDLFKHTVNAPPYYVGETDTLSADFEAVMQQINAPATKGDYIDANAVNAAFSNFTPAEIALLCYTNVTGGDNLDLTGSAERADSEGTLVDALNELSNFYGQDSKLDKNQLKILKMVANAYEQGKIYKTKRLDQYFNLLNSNPKKMFYALSSAVMTPKSVGIQLKQFGESLPENVECWFSGKCVGIPAPTFAKILLALKEQNVKVSTKYMVDFEYELERIDKNEFSKKKPDEDI